MEKSKSNKPSPENIKQWSEGNVHLEELLKSCVINNVPSYWCCEGHGKGSAHISLELSENTENKIYNAINNIKEKDGVSISLTKYIANEKNNERDGMHIDIKNENNKNEVFDIISQSLEAPLNEKNETIEIIRKVQKVFLNLKNTFPYISINYELIYPKKITMRFQGGKNHELAKNLVSIGFDIKSVYEKYVYKCEVKIKNLEEELDILEKLKVLTERNNDTNDSSEESER